MNLHEKAQILCSRPWFLRLAGHAHLTKTRRFCHSAGAFIWQPNTAEIYWFSCDVEFFSCVPRSGRLTTEKIEEKLQFMCNLVHDWLQIVRNSVLDARQVVTKSPKSVNSNHESGFYIFRFSVCVHSVHSLCVSTTKQKNIRNKIKEINFACLPCPTTEWLESDRNRKAWEAV